MEYSAKVSMRVLIADDQRGVGTTLAALVACGAIVPSWLISSAIFVVGINRAPGMNKERSRSLTLLPAGPEMTSLVAIMMASIDAMSAGLATGMFVVRGLMFDLIVSALNSQPSTSRTLMPVTDYAGKFPRLTIFPPDHCKLEGATIVSSSLWQKRCSPISMAP